MKESIFVTLQKCTVFEGYTPEEIRETLSMVSYRMVELAARETYVLAGMPCRYADIIVEGEMIARMSGLSGKQAQIERLGESMLIAPAYKRDARKRGDKQEDYPPAHEAFGTETADRYRRAHTLELHPAPVKDRYLPFAENAHALPFLRQGEGGAIPHQDGYRTAEQNHPTGCQPPGNGGYLRYPEVLAPPLPLRIRGEGCHQD